MNEWRWNGTIWDFAEFVQWALVFRQLSKDKPAGWSQMVSNPKMIEKKAEEYGMTFRAITDEMLRIGTNLDRMMSITEKKEDSEEQ